MNGAKIHRDENGFETFVCSKCKDKKERLNGIQTEKSKKKRQTNRDINGYVICALPHIFRRWHTKGG